MFTGLLFGLKLFWYVFIFCVSYADMYYTFIFFLCFHVSIYIDICIYSILLYVCISFHMYICTQLYFFMS